MLRERESKVNAEIKRVLDFARKPKVEKRVLGNGLTLIAVEGEKPIFETILNVNAGYRHDPKGNPGVAHLTEHMVVTGGTHRHPCNEIHGAFSALGAHLVAYTNPTFTQYIFDQSRTFKTDTPALLETLSETIFEASFAENFGFEKGRMKREMEDKDCHLAKAMDLFLSSKYEGKVGSITYPKEMIDKISIDDIKRFYSSFYAPNNAVLGILGQIDAQTIDSASQILSSYSAKELKEEDLTVKEKMAEKTVFVPSFGSHIGYFFPAPSQGDANISMACKILYNKLYSLKNIGVTYFPYYIPGPGEIGFIGMRMYGPGLKSKDRKEDVQTTIEEEIKGIGNGDLAEDEIIRAKEELLNEFYRAHYSSDTERLKTVLDAEAGCDRADVIAGLLTSTRESIATAVREHMSLKKVFKVIHEPTFRAIRGFIKNC